MLVGEFVVSAVANVVESTLDPQPERLARSGVRTPLEGEQPEPVWVEKEARLIFVLVSSTPLFKGN